jgi:Ni,Fe-hydrogenase III large subunit
MMPDEKRRIESCMRTNGYQGHVIRFNKAPRGEYLYYVRWNDGKKYLVDVDRSKVNEMREDYVGED